MFGNETWDVVVGDEHSAELPYPFLVGLSKDHPILVQAVLSKLDAWKEWMNKELGNDQITEILLSRLEYVSLEEMDRSLEAWTQEIQEKLESDTNRKILILEGVGGSQSYFAKGVFDRIPEELRERVTITGRNAQIERLQHITDDLDVFANTDYFLFDDSVNSGQQLCEMILPFFREMPERLENTSIEEARGIDFQNIISKRRKKPSLNIRTMRMTEYGERRVREKWKKQKDSTEAGRVYPTLVELDIKFDKRMPTVEDVLAPLQLPWVKGKRPAFLFHQPQVIGDTTMGFFGTKIQDNLPAAIVKSRVTPLGLEPLFNRADIKTPWQSFIT